MEKKQKLVHETTLTEDEAMEVFMTLTEDDIMEVLRSIASDISDYKLKEIEDIVNENRQQGLVEKINALPIELQSRILKNAYDLHMQKNIESFDCDNEDRLINSYKELVNKMISFCMDVPTNYLENMNETERNKQRRIAIRGCVDDYKAQLVKKCNNQPFEDDVTITLSLDGFKSKSITYKAPFVGDVTLESENPEGACITEHRRLPGMVGETLQDKTLRVRFQFGDKYDIHASGLVKHEEIGERVVARVTRFENEDLNQIHNEYINGDGDEIILYTDAYIQFEDRMFEIFESINGIIHDHEDAFHLLLKRYRFKKIEFNHLKDMYEAILEYIEEFKNRS